VLVEPGDFHTGFTASRRTIKASEAYQANMTRALEVSEHDELHGAHPDKLAALIDRIVRSRRPRLRYIVGPFYERIAVWLKKILPPRLFEWALSMYYKQK